MELTWTDMLSVGNETIDTEHKALFKMLNGIEVTIRQRDYRGLLNAMEAFEKAVQSHFLNEAAIARAVNYPFEEHRLEHDYVLGELRAMCNELRAKEGKWSESTVEYCYSFLSEWTDMHIREDDMRLKPILDTYPYGFKPPEV